jgi:hypothetical protein
MYDEIFNACPSFLSHASFYMEIIPMLLMQEKDSLALDTGHKNNVYHCYYVCSFVLSTSILPDHTQSCVTLLLGVIKIF